MALILVIDDEEGMRVLLREILEKDGHDVLEAPDGIVGMDLFREKQPDLVITDIFMPEKEGMETILELRRHDPRVKVIAISGGELAASLKVLDTARDFGALRVVAKPFTPKEMIRTVKEVLGH